MCQYLILRDPLQCFLLWVVHWLQKNSFGGESGVGIFVVWEAVWRFGTFCMGSCNPRGIRLFDLISL